MLKKAMQLYINYWVFWFAKSFFVISNIIFKELNNFIINNFIILFVNIVNYFTLTYI